MLSTGIFTVLQQGGSRGKVHVETEWFCAVLEDIVCLFAVSVCRLRSVISCERYGYPVYTNNYLVPPGGV